MKISDFLEFPEKKKLNVFFKKDQKLSRDQFYKNINFTIIKKKQNFNFHTIIFSFNKFDEIKKFNKLLLPKIRKKKIYFLFNIYNSSFLEKLHVLIYFLFKIKKNPIIFSTKYSNSFIPFLLHRIKYNSFLASSCYLIYQLVTNILLIFFGSFLLIKIK
jgi:hypothetical protein